ncbi:MAG: hypothetical protein KKC85_07195 [Gammaproteobacteria bacterium]|nr:hypothetical protein [Gammaproteobacteria bacterium]MBU1443077.1 hypothetical protein [Gammaproteobacteria bacterium]MBU2286203.1 hypothetical protein [Gammaproteobacteria bacterium]
MKKICFALGAAALVSLGMLTAPAHAQYRGDQRYPHNVIVVPAPPHHVYRPPPRHWHAPPPRYSRHDGYHHRRHGWRDNDRDGVPNRYDHRPNNPYRR